MIGIKTLTIGYTKDIELAEKVARATGAKHLSVETRPEGDTLSLNTEEQAEWRRRGWKLEGRTAKKALMANVVEDHARDGIKEETKSEVQKNEAQGGYSEGGRLKANMLVDMTREGSSGVKDGSSSGQGDDETDDESNEQSEETDDEPNPERELRAQRMNDETNE